MYTLDFWPTPNGYKPLVFLIEAGLPYELHPVNIGKGDQFEPDFLLRSPNNRIPALTDRDVKGTPITVFESGAILLYLAEKTGAFIETDARGRVRMLEWLFWQMGGFGPMLGQNHHFAVYAPEPIPYAVDRYRKETRRLYGVLETRLRQSAYVASDAYGIADMAIWPWTVSHERQGVDLEDFPQIHRWSEAVAARPAVIRAYEEGRAISPPRAHPPSDEERENLYGSRQFQR